MTELFLKTLHMGLMAEYCVLVVLAVRFLLRKQPKIYSYLLWAVVYFRLICPVSVQSTFSLIKIHPQKIIADVMTGINTWAAGTALSQVSPDMAGTGLSAEIGAGAIAGAGALTGSGAGTMAGAGTGAMTGSGAGATTGAMAGADVGTMAGAGALSAAENSAMVGERIGRSSVTNLSPALTETQPEPAWLYMAGVLWIVVTALLFLYYIWALLRLKRQLRVGKLVEPYTYEIENLQTPFVMGVLKPHIYLPAHLDDAERKYVLAHEKTHIRRRDYLIKQAAFLISCVYWYHPLVWLAFYLMCQDMEMSCDESVIRSLGGTEKKEYSASLLSLASDRKILLGSPLAFGGNNIKSRIMNVLCYRRPAVWASACFVGVLAVILIGLALNPLENVAAQDRDKNMPTQEENKNISTQDSDRKTFVQDSANTASTQEESSNTFEQGDNTAPTQEKGSNTFEQDGNMQSENSYEEAMHYAGYLNESPYTIWQENWMDCDFDADGRRDRVYRDVTAEGVSYRIDFGNDEKLEIGTFTDLYTGISIQTADVEGDGCMEILFVGKHETENTPLPESEVALFYKKDGNYLRQELYQERTEEIKPIDMHAGNRGGGHGAFAAGFAIYAYDMGEDGILLSNPETKLEQLAIVPEGLDYKKMYRPDYSPALAAGQAYDAEFIRHDGKICLGLYENPGGSWIDWSWRFVLNLEKLGDTSIPLAERVVYRDIAGTFERLPEVSPRELETLRSMKVEEQLELWKKQPHRKNYQNAVLQMYVPKRLADSVHIDEDMLSLNDREALSQEALQELYDLTGTLVETCCYYYTDNYDFYFALTKEDMESGRIFYNRNFGELGMSVSSMWLTNARKLWYSPIYQYDLPVDFEAYTDSEKAVWFLENSALYNGKEIAVCAQPYADMPEVWQIIMEDDTAYEITLDADRNVLENISGPYPSSKIVH